MYPGIVIRVDDIEQKLEQIKKAGGAVVKGRTEIPEVGMVYASFADTEGIVVNIVGDL
jgi:predicted enzyme related to lactoylglutathione lyase